MDLLKLLWGLILGHLYLGAVSAQVSVNGSLGGSVDFPVYITLPADRSIIWRTGGGAVVIARILNNNAPSYNTSYASRTQLFPNGTLRLDKLTDADKRLYTVTVENQVDFTAQTAEYQLGVFPPLTAPVLRSNFTSSLLISDSYVTLQCDAGNQNVTSYTFYRDDQKIICSDRVICRGSFLDFTPISEHDSGSYTCAIQNPVSTNTSDSLRLTVTAPVSNVTLTSNTSGMLWVNQDSVSLLCSARGTSVSFAWSLQGAPLPDISRYHLTENNSTLIISPVTKNDSGLFNCLAANIVNSAYSIGMNLRLAWPPDDRINCGALLSNNNTSLLCSWRGGQPSAQLTLVSQGFSETGNDEVIRTVSPEIIFKGLDITCHGIQAERSVMCHVYLEPPSMSRFSGGETAGIVIGVVAGILILEVIIFLILKRRKKTPPITVYENTNMGHPIPQHPYEKTMPRAEQLTHRVSAQYDTVVTAFSK